MNKMYNTELTNKEKKFDVTIVVCNYNPILHKLEETLDSCVIQKNIAFQIVVSDDGSKEPYFEKLRNYFKEKKFNDYKLLSVKKNEGTVKNVYKGVLAADGEYIKIISPGDSLKGEEVLCNWVKALEKSKKKWSFSDAIYYRVVNDKKEYIVHEAHPQMVEPYVKNKDKWCRWNYVALEDITIGAATLCGRDVCLRYLERIKDHVIYAEDNIYRLMMYDNIVAYYYPYETIYYEYGEGVSTNGNDLWQKRLANDWKQTNNIMLESIETRDKLKEKMCRELELSQKGCCFLWKPYRYRRIKKKLFTILWKRYTKTC